MFEADIKSQRLSRMHGFRQWRWHVNEVFVKINRETYYLWRAADHEGEILERYATKKRDKNAALHFSKKTLQKFASVHANVYNHFYSDHHLVDRPTYTANRSAELAEWQISWPDRFDAVGDALRSG